MTTQLLQLKELERIAETVERIEALLISAEKARDKQFASGAPMPRLTRANVAKPRAPK